MPFVALRSHSRHPYPSRTGLARRGLNDLAVADDKVTMFEYCLTRLVWSYLLDVADPSRRSKVGNGSLTGCARW